MAKPTGALISFDARGQLGKTAVYASWRGRQYVRRYVIPANPSSTPQQLTRQVFAYLSGLWKISGPLFQGGWTAYAAGKVLTNRNALNMFNVGQIRTAASNSAATFSPGAKGGLALQSAAGTRVTTTLTITYVQPPIPASWTLTDVAAAAINLGAFAPPTPAPSPVEVEGDDTGLTGTIVLTVADIEQVWGVWPIWMKPDGSTAYGPSIMGLAT